MEKGAFSPKLRATIVTLAALLMSRRTTLALLKTMLGARISVGSIDNILKQAGELLASPWQAIHVLPRVREALHADETAQDRSGHWAVGLALSATACCFRIDQTRARSAAKTLLGDFDGLLISDRYSVYDFIEPQRRQACLAHLARTFQRFLAQSATRPAARHAGTIRQSIHEVIRADSHARHCGQQISWGSSMGATEKLHDQLMDAVENGERSRTPDLARLCATVLDIWPTLWNFTEQPDAQERNNRCERAISSASPAQDEPRHPVRGRRPVRRTDPLDPRDLPPHDESLHDYLIDVHHARLTGADTPIPLGITQIAT